jgi:hypothetical protein
MCTVSWTYQPGGYQLLFNRDERSSRKPAEPPTLREQHGMRCIVPSDGDYGGTWIGVNQYGMTICLLNRYDQHDAAQVYTSRGLLVLDILDSRSCEQVLSRLCVLDLTLFRPFTMVVLAPLPPSLVLHWTGNELQAEYAAESARPLISSSYDPTNVATHRKQLFRDMAITLGDITPAMLYAFHASHLPAANAYSVCMHREDAATRSLSWITVDAHMIAFLYQPHPPCRQSSTQVIARDIPLDWYKQPALPPFVQVVKMEGQHA